MAGKTGLNKRANEQVMDAIFETLGQILADGERLVISGFGTFTTKQRAARIARNPGTGEVVPVPAMRTAVFRPAQAYKDRLAATGKGGKGTDARKETR